MREKIQSLSIDLETYSNVDLKKSGVYPYAESSDFEILLFAYAVNEGGCRSWILPAGKKSPMKFCRH